MNAHVRIDYDHRYAHSALNKLESKLDHILNLARAASVVVEHQLGREEPAAMLDSLLGAIADTAREAEETRSQAVAPAPIYSLTKPTA